MHAVIIAAICLGIMVAGMALVLLLSDKKTAAVIAWVGITGGLIALIAGVSGLAQGNLTGVMLWSMPGLGHLKLYVDRMSALFILVSGLVFVAVSLFSAQYMKAYAGRIRMKTFGIEYLALFASIIAVLVAGDVFSFLIAWEGMSILSFLTVNTHCESTPARRAAYLMLAIGEAGTLSVTVALILLANKAGSTDFHAIATAMAHVGPGLRWTVFLLSFFGFATKVGLFPVNTWLPKAHPVAPANVSAMLSGLILNLGIYGILRVNFMLLPVNSPGPGIVVMLTGATSAVIGILYATITNDIKQVLAHSSIENMGIITTGMGAAMVFHALGHPVFASMALVAALYHMVNHSMYKSLLFLGAGSVDTRAGTRDLDRLGGLMRVMPWTGVFMLAGVMAIAALPPFNGFVSEWLSIEALLRSVELASTGIKLAFVLSGIALALTAGLAVTAFVRFFAMGFLGMPRSESARNARETGPLAITALALLAIVSFGLGVMPTYVIPALDRVSSPMTQASAATALVPPFFRNQAFGHELPDGFVRDFHNIGAQVGSTLPGRGLVVMHRGGKSNPVVFAMSSSYTFVMLAFLLGLLFLVVRFATARRAKTVHNQPWDGGIPRLWPEMTYTATGFAHPVRVLFETLLRPKVSNRRQSIARHFRMVIEHRRNEVYLVDRLVLKPVSQASGWIANKLAVMHNGKVNAYALYILITIILAFVLF